jgi:integrase
MEVNVLRGMLKRAKRWNQIADDVHNLPENHAVVGRALPVEDKVRLFETAASRDEWMAAYCAAVIAVNTTCRGVEIRSLRWRDLDLAKSVVQISRSKNEEGHRLIPLNDESLAALSLLRQRAELLGDGEPIISFSRRVKTTSLISRGIRRVGGPRGGGLRKPLD